MFFRMVGFGGLAFVVATSSLLSAVIVRSPQTHDHIASSLSPEYIRTSLDSIGPADLTAIIADLPRFSFPEPPQLVAASALFSASSAEGSGDQTAPVNGTVESTAQQQPKVQEIAFDQFEFEFSQERIELKVGVPVKLTLTNQGDQVQGLWIPEFAIMADIRSGKNKEFTFIPEKSGRFRFTCSYNLCGTEEEHAQMKGYIIVT